MASKAICASCQASVDSIGRSWLNEKKQTLTKIKPHWHSNRDGMPCNARIGIVAK